MSAKSKKAEPKERKLELTEESVELQKLDSVETSKNVKDVEIEDENSDVKPTPLAHVVAEEVHEHAHYDDHRTHIARRFLVAYLVSIFSALSLLVSTSFLAFVLINHFVAGRTDQATLFFLDLSPVYIVFMSVSIVSALLYALSTRYVASSAAKGEIGWRDWRRYKIIYAFFTAALLTLAAPVVASLLYIPLAQIMIADDLSGSQVTVQVLTSLYILAWIAVLIWQERLVKNSKHNNLQGVIVVAVALIVVVLVGTFPIGSKAGQRQDNRTANDLSAIESEIQKYKTTHEGSLPTTLSDLDITGDSPVKSRLSNYKYTVKDAPRQSPSQAESSSSSQSEDMGDSDLSALFGSGNVSTRVGDKVYELCATFKTDTTKDQAGLVNPIAAITNPSSTVSSYSYGSHKSGEVCFDRQ